MSGTVNYSDEDKLLTSDEFIAAAKQNADKNLQIQKDTAQKVYDSTYASLDRQYNEAAAAAGVAKERNLIDADTAYQRQEMKYGAEQEALAAAGLSGSGMNEYRRAQSYQKNREDRQMSYAEYDRALREANYTRDQGKLAADLNKAQSDAAAEMHYNDTMTGIAEKELGYSDLERQEIDAAYSGYLAGIEDGSLTMDQIKADSSWEKLSDGQKEAVVTASTVKGLKGRIDNGESWAEIEASDAYKSLGDEGKNQVAGYHAQVVASKTKDAEAALGSYLEMANAGWSIDDIVAAATGNGHYGILTESGSWQSVVNAVNGYAEDKAAEETETNFTTAIGLINNGWTLEEVKSYFGGDLAKALGEKNAGQLEQVANVADRIKKDTEGKAASEALTSYVQLALDGMSIDAIQKIAESLGHYGVLSAKNPDGTSLWDAVEAEAESYANKQSEATRDEAYNSILTAISNGTSLDALKQSGAWGYLTPEQQNAISKSYYDGGLNYLITAEESAGGAYSKSEAESTLRGAGYSEADITNIIGYWQEYNAMETVKEISGGTVEIVKSEFGVDLPMLKVNGLAIAVEDIVYDIENDMFGDGGRAVANAYADAMIKFISDGSVTANMGGRAYLDAKKLKNYMDPEKWNALKSAYDDLKNKQAVPPRKVTHIKDLAYEINGERIVIEKQADSTTLDTLNERYPDSYLIYVELNGNGYIALGGGRWGKTRKRASK